ncbi:MAG: hypothetical protein KGQ36_00165 [Rickettsiales bacterium]|nr:hypothetical protein [Rickettsiales bacterium]
MKKLLVLLSVVLLSSCVSVKSTLSQHNFSMKDDVSSTSREGEACSVSVLGFYFGDRTVDKAAKSAEIKEVVFVEQKIQNFPFYIKICTVVKGK